MTTRGNRISDPSRVSAADYDYTNGNVDNPTVVADLEKHLEGDIRFDEYTKQLYATDASAYKVVPIGVVFPASTADVAETVEYCAKWEIPILPRGGGTSLAGQAVNEAVVLDFSRYMNEVLTIDADECTTVVQAGTVLAELNEAVAPEGLKFGPDPAAGDRSVLGGAIGNNSTGAHSLIYGKTDHYVEEAEVVLADGTVHRFGEIAVDELRAKSAPDAEAWGSAGPPSDLLPRIYAEIVRILDEEADEINTRYPDLKRNVSGYNLDVLVDESRSERSLHGESGIGSVDEHRTVNLARLLAGSEGTLAVITEATVSLEPIPETKAVALLTYEDVIDAAADVAPVLTHSPSAVELIDDVLIDLALDTAEFHDVAASLPEGTRGALLVEFYADSEEHGRQQVADLLAERVPSASPTSKPSEQVGPAADARAFHALEAHDAEARAGLWKMRKAAAPILLSRTTDEKHISFIEDCAVPADRLPEYVEHFREVIDTHNANTSFYAHAGPGVLHVRPLVNTKSIEGLETFETIADKVTDFVVELDGSVSGEHGDGHARTQWNRKLYGDRLWNVFRDLKSSYDPDWILNPGNVCGNHDMTDDLRFDPDYEFDAEFDPTLNWENDNGFQGMAELCHGCGGCRGGQETAGGVMCPTYRATEEEIQSTRGRANMLRQAMSGELNDEEQFSDEFVDEVLDLCVGCKGCARDCPSEVDMAKMKVEVLHEQHQRDGAGFRDHIFANIDRLSALGSALAPLSNVASSLPGARTIMEKTVGIAADRDLPTFENETLIDWFNNRESDIPTSRSTRKALIFPDTYTNYSDPAVGKATVRVLEAAGIHVDLADQTDSGRPAHSKGFLDKSHQVAERNVSELMPRIKQGWDIVLIEPSDAVMFQSDYCDLISGNAVKTIAANSYGIMEYLDIFDLDSSLSTNTRAESLTYHGHCHQKAIKKDHHAVGVLRRTGYRVDPLDSTCCGMAGSFGYESEHYSMSKAIASILYEQADESFGDSIVAPGASCRTQLREENNQVRTPIEMVELALE